MSEDKKTSAAATPAPKAAPAATANVNELVEQLRDGRANVRASAARGLAAAGQPVLGLVMQLRDSEHVAAHAAVEAIAKLGTAARPLVVPIVQAVDGTQPEVTDKVITLLAELAGAADEELI